MFRDHAHLSPKAGIPDRPGDRQMNPQQRPLNCYEVLRAGRANAPRQFDRVFATQLRLISSDEPACASCQCADGNADLSRTKGLYRADGCDCGDDHDDQPARARSSVASADECARIRRPPCNAGLIGSLCGRCSPEISTRPGVNIALASLRRYQLAEMDKSAIDV